VEAGGCADATYEGQEIETDPLCQYQGELGDVGNNETWTMPDLNGFTPNNDHSGIAMTPILASFTDDNGDGKFDQDDIPDIAATSYREQRGIIRVLSGDDGRELWTQSSQVNLQPQSGLAAGDIDNDGIIEVVAVTNDGRAVAFEHNGQVKWTSDSIANGIFGQFDNPAIANLDGTGRPEIIVGAAILDADGTILGIGTEGQGGLRGTAAFAADVDGDGTQEVVVGNALYDMTGATIWSNGENDGFPAIADLDEDGSPEVIVSNRGEIRVQDANDGTIIWTVEVPNATDSGPPTIDDFDGDGEPEVAVVTSKKLVVLDGDGTEIWSINNRSDQCNSQDCKDCEGFKDGSGVLGLSAFDIDGGGVSELVLIDETHIWMYAGDDGKAKMCSNKHESPSLLEYAIIADANGDGKADLVSPGAPPDGAGHHSTNQGLKLFESSHDDWASGRRIWNQYAYSVTNVNDDGTIPDQPEQNWLTFNNFRSGAVQATDGVLASDLVGEISYVCTGECTEDRMVVWAHVGNAGLADIQGDVDLTLYAVASDGEEVEIGAAKLEGGIEAGRLSESIQIDVIQLDSVELDALMLSVDGGNRAPASGAWSECNEVNNEFTYEDRICEG